MEAEEVLHGLVDVDVPAGVDGVDAPSLGGGPELGLPHGVAVDVLDEDGLGEGRAMVDAGASVAVAAGADLEVERAVHFVLLGAMDAGQVAGSCCPRSHRHDVVMRPVHVQRGIPALPGWYPTTVACTSQWGGGGYGGGG